MAITLVQSDDAGVANATVTTINMPGAITAGNLLVATMAVRQHATTWTITGITGWSGPYSTHSERDSGTTQKNLRMWWKVAGSSESTTITFTGSALSTTAIVVSEWAGFTSPTLAAFTPTHTSTISVASATIQTLTPNSGVGLALLASTFRTTSPVTEASANNSYAEADEAVSAAGGVLGQWLGWKEVSSTAESITTVSWTTTTPPLMTAYVFTEAGVGVKEPYLVSAGDVLLGGYDTGTQTGALMPDAKLANDVAILSVSAQNASTFTTPSGWTEFTGTAQNDAAWSTAWFWKRLDGSETDGTSTVSTTLTSGSVAAFARIYLFRNCITSGDPFEDVTMNGSPTFSTTPTSSAIDTTGPRLAVALAAVEDNNSITNSPPSGWVGVGWQISGAGSDGSMDGIWRIVPSAQSVSAVALHTQSAAESWRTMTLALIPVPAVVLPAPILAYNFAETGTSVTDRSGNGRTASMLNGSTPTDLHSSGEFAPTASGHHLAYNATSDAAAVPTVCSFTCKLRTLSGTGEGALWSRMRANDSTGLRISYAGERITYGLRTEPFAIHFGDNGSNLSHNTTYQVAFTYDGAQILLYINGTLTHTNTDPTGNLNQDGNKIWKSGYDVDINFGTFLPFIVDDIRFFDVVLTPDQVALAAVTPVTSAGPVDYDELNLPVSITATITCTDTFSGIFVPVTFFDDFNRADGAIGNGWVDLTGAASLPTISGNRAIAPVVAGTYGALRPSSEDFSEYQFVQITGQLGGDYSELLVLAHFTVNEHGYLMTWVTDGSTGFGGSVDGYVNQIWRGRGTVDGVYDLVWESPSYSSGVRTLRGYCLGNRLVLMMGGVVMADLIDAAPAPAGGNPGFSVHQGPSGTTYADNFFATDINPAALPTFAGPDYIETWTGSDGAAWPAGWAVVGPTYGTTSATIQGNKGQQSNNDAGAGFSFRTDMRTYVPADFDATFDLSITAGQNASPRLYFRRSTDGTHVSLVNFDTAANQVRIEYSTDGSTTIVVDTQAFTYTTGTYHCRVRAVGLSVAGKIWSGSTEPVSWQVSGNVVDTSGSANQIGFALARLTAGTATVQYDDLQLRSLVPTGLVFTETIRNVSITATVTVADTHTTLGNYTELEWNLKLQAPATIGDTYEFRVYDGSTELADYAVTPQLTVATAGVNYSETGRQISVTATVAVPTDQADFKEPSRPVVIVAATSVQDNLVGAPNNYNETGRLVAVVAVVSLPTDQADYDQLALPVPLVAAVSLPIDRYERYDLALAVPIAAAVSTPTDRANRKEPTLAVPVVSTISVTDLVKRIETSKGVPVVAAVSVTDRAGRKDLALTVPVTALVATTDQADFKDLQRGVPVVSAVSVQDNLSGAPINYNEIGRLVAIVSVVALPVDQADYDQLAIPVPIIAATSITTVVRRRDLTLSVPITSTVALPTDQADYKDLSRAVPVVSGITLIEFTGAFNETGRLVAITSVVVTTNRAFYRNPIALDVSSTVSLTDQADYHQLLAVLIVSTIGLTDLQRYASGVVLNTALALYLGSTPVSKVYAGSVQVWP